jgi:hypothetical protein
MALQGLRQLLGRQEHGPVQQHQLNKSIIAIFFMNISNYFHCFNYYFHYFNIEAGSFSTSALLLEDPWFHGLCTAAGPLRKLTKPDFTH